jgi:hypothetical protein
MEDLYVEANATSYRFNVFIAKGYSIDDVIKIARQWEPKFFALARVRRTVYGYVEWGKSLKTSTIRNKGPFEWYAKAGTSEEVYDALSAMSGFYEEGVMTKMGRPSSPKKRSPKVKSPNQTKSETSASRVSPRRYTNRTKSEECNECENKVIELEKKNRILECENDEAKWKHVENETRIMFAKDTEIHKLKRQLIKEQCLLEELKRGETRKSMVGKAVPVIKTRKV